MKRARDYVVVEEGGNDDIDKYEEKDNGNDGNDVNDDNDGHIDTKLSLKVVGIKHYFNDRGESYLDGALKNEVIRIERDPTNEFDLNCIRVYTGKYQIGCIEAAQAKQLTSLIDKEKAIINNCIIVKNYEDYHVLECQVQVAKSDDNKNSIEDITFYGSNSMKHDRWVERTDSKIPNGSFQLAQSNLRLAKESVGESFEEKEIGSHCPILPTPTFFSSMNYGEASDSIWWLQWGLRPPSTWKINPVVVLDTSSLSYSRSTKQTEINREIEMMSKVNGVQCCWDEDFIKEIIDLLNSDNFFSNVPGESVTKKDQLIAVYGGLGYVLGQKKENLILCHQREHNEVTRKLCNGKNLIYTVLNLRKPPSPGFNTIIFGLTHRGSGFGYHSDQVKDLVAKDVTMVPNQPVSTTVLYEKPELDDGKESVHWISKSSSQERWSGTFLNPYQSLYYLRTYDSSEHVQFEGLQTISKHAVLHSLPKTSDGGSSRQGCRIAITSRISYDDNENIEKSNIMRNAKNIKKNYSKVIPSEGDVTIKWKSRQV